jgi:hypothetical protein
MLITQESRRHSPPAGGDPYLSFAGILAHATLSHRCTYGAATSGVKRRRNIACHIAAERRCGPPVAVESCGRRPSSPAAEHRRSAGARIAAARPLPHRLYPIPAAPCAKIWPAKRRGKTEHQDRSRPRRRSRSVSVQPETRRREPRSCRRIARACATDEWRQLRRRSWR